MNTLSILLTWVALSFGCLAAPLRAQLAATTLDELTQRATTIVRVRVLAVELPETGEASAVFRTLEVVSGEAPPTGIFTIVEPAGRACGRSLHGLLQGSSYLAFLTRRTPADELGLLGGGGRTLVGIEPGIVEHVRSLASADAAGRTALLLEALETPNLRVRDDAAIALGHSTAITALTGEQRDRLAAAARDALPRDDHAAFGLLNAVERYGLTDELPHLLDHFVREPGAALSPRLHRTIVTLARRAGESANAVFGAALVVPPTELPTRVHVLELLEALPAAAARDGLRQALDAPDPTLRRRAGVAWLRAGLDATELDTRFTADELRLCRACVDQAPTFRSLQGMPRR